VGRIAKGKVCAGMKEGKSDSTGLANRSEKETADNFQRGKEKRKVKNTLWGCKSSVFTGRAAGGERLGRGPKKGTRHQGGVIRGLYYDVTGTL